jgi:hypothetical protein
MISSTAGDGGGAMHTAVALFAIVMGVSIATIWTRDLVRGSVDLSHGPFRAREPGSNSLLWPHWLAEYGAAAALVVGGAGLLVDIGWGEPVSLLGLGACAYTSINSLGWALARADRRQYGIPMVIGAVGSVASAVALLAT